MKVLNAFTVDVEDYFGVTGFEKDISRSQWDRYDSRVVASTHRILDLLDRHGVGATFFVLGWVARRHPKLVCDIHRAGHEIGSHGYWHRLIYDQTPEEFRKDLRQSRDLLAEIISEPIVAYRAPSFSITQDSRWALEILVEEGFLYDSSVFPIYHDRYGIPDAQPRIHQLDTSAGRLWEFPPSITRLARLNIPVSGGGYFRLYPLPLTIYWLARINRCAGQPFMFYIHPWEVDPQQPRLRAGTRISRIRHYVNLAKTERRMDVLLRKFRFGRLCDVIKQVDFQSDPNSTNAQLSPSA